MRNKLVLLSFVMVIVLGSTANSFAELHIESVDVVENKLVTLLGTAIDSDDDTLVYHWKQIYGDTVELSSVSELEPTFMAPEVTNGYIKVLTFELTVTDALGSSSSDIVEVVVNPVNHAPTVDAGRDHLVLPGIQAMSIFPTIYDEDGDDLTYFWEQISGKLVMLESTNEKHLTVLPMTVDYTDFEPIEFQLTVKDGFGGVGSDKVQIVPFVESKENKKITIKATPTQIVYEGDVVTINVSGTTLNNAPITYTWNQVNTPMIDLDTKYGNSITFVAPEIGDDNVLLTFRITGYSEGNGYAQATAFVNVLPSNNPPVADAGPDKNTPEKKLVKLEGVGMDPDGDVNLKFSWNQITGIPVEIYERTTSSVYFFAPDVSSAQQLTFQFKVDDRHGGIDTDAMNVNITYVNSPPKAFAGDDKRVLTGTNVSLSGNGVDIDGDELTYQWTQIYGDNVEFDGTNANISFTSPKVNSNEIKRLGFELTVTDIHEQTGVDRVVIFVIPENSAPTANVGSDLTVGESTPISLTCLGSDPDLDDLTYAWSSPDVDFGVNTNQVFTFKTFNVVVDTTITMSCAVSDGEFMAYDSMQLTVTNLLSLDIIANAGPDRMVNENARVFLDGRNSNDPENQEIFFTWKQIGGESIELSNTSSVRPYFITPIVENTKVKVLTFELTINDKHGRTASDTVVLTVDPINSPPKATASARQ